MGIKTVRTILSGIMLLALFLSFFGAGNLSSAGAQSAWTASPASALTAYHVLSDGQFVYGPNIGDFVLRTYFEANAPHLSNYADDLYGRAEYYSINPKIYLTLLEIHSQLISSPDAVDMENPFDLNNDGFIAHMDLLSEKMSAAYYLHLYSFSALPVSQRNLPPFVTSDGTTIHVPAETNAGTYAVIAGLAAINQQNIPIILDNGYVNGFYQTYRRLFGNDDPLDETNKIIIPGEVGALAAPDYLLQLPYPRGVSWRFGGVHNASGAPTFTDASSLDFYPSSSGNFTTPPLDTSNMWVVAAASGVLSTFPSLSSTCGIKISHSGAVNSGWETTYYHLENVQKYSGAVNQNEKIGVIANTLAEATCVGGASTGPHVHFSLKYNGAYFPINATALSGWFVHAGRWSYDTDAAYMWLERAGVKKYPSAPTYDVVLSEAPPALPVVSSIVRSGTNPSSSTSVNFTVTFSKSITGVNTEAPFNDFILSTTGLAGTSITSVTGSGSTYTVTVNTGSGNGTIRLDLVDDNSIVDSASNRLGGAAVGDGNFTTGQAYTINKDGTVTDTWALQVSPSANISQLAVQLGAQNLGQIGSLSIFYLFRVSGSDSQAKIFADLLAANPQVLWFEQQVARGQSKRDNTDPITPYPSKENLADAATVPTAIDGMSFQDKSSEVSSINTLPVTSSPEPIEIAATITESYPTTTPPFTPVPMSTQTNISPITSPIPTQITIAQRPPASIPTRLVQSTKIAALPNESSMIPTVMIRSSIPSTESGNHSGNGDTLAAVLSIASIAIGSVLFSIRRKK
jgi:LasA protease